MPPTSLPTALDVTLHAAAAGLPEGSIVDTDPGEYSLTRRGVLQSKRHLQAHRELAFKETRGMRTSPEKNQLYKEIKACNSEEDLLEQHLQERFLPQHGPGQFLSPRAFFASPLFRVRSKTMPRENHLELDLPTTFRQTPVRYAGPELRQMDGLVFLALINMLRDIRVGTAVCIQPEAVCKSLFGRYDGSSRHKLREHIQRLQKGLIISGDFSVQLCLHFDFPRTGGWMVGLDPNIVALFSGLPQVWLRMPPRLSLPDGMATWLYAFIESQTRLIPMPLSSLCKLCGSAAGDKGFTNRFRDAMHQLAKDGIIDTGWSVRNGQVRWLKLK